MVEKLEKVTDDTLKFFDNMGGYILGVSFFMVMVGCGLYQLKFHNISSLFLIIGMLIMIVMLIIAILGFIIILIVETIKKIKRR